MMLPQDLKPSPNLSARWKRCATQNPYSWVGDGMPGPFHFAPPGDFHFDPDDSFVLRSHFLCFLLVLTCQLWPT